MTTQYLTVFLSRCTGKVQRFACTRRYKASGIDSYGVRDEKTHVQIISVYIKSKLRLAHSAMVEDD